MGDTFSLDPEPRRLSDVAGFRTGVASCGLKSEGPDIGVLVCDNPEGAGTAIMTKNPVRAAPVRVSSPRATTGLLRAVIVNSGNPNCYTGEDGLRDAREMIELAAAGLDVPQECVMVASNGAAVSAKGRALPMEAVRRGVDEACRDAKESGQGDFAAAIAAEDVPCMVASASGAVEGKAFQIAGAARGASLSTPDMATTFAFIATDMAISPECLSEVLSSASERTFARLVADGGKSTNDTLCVLASARAGNEIIDNIFSAGVFAEALEAVARQLIAEAAPGGESAARPIEVRVSGAESEHGAEQVSRAVAQSIAVRTAIQNGDPNWGVILAAAGRFAPDLNGSRATVRIAGEVVFDKGRPVDPPPEGLKEKLRGPGVTIEVDLGQGSASAALWAHSLPTGNQEELARARRAAKEAAAAAEQAEKQRAELEAERQSLDAKLAEEVSAREAVSRETVALKTRLDESEEVKAAAEAQRKDFEAKLKEAEAGREAASQETTRLSKRLEAIERAAEETKAASAAQRKALEDKLKQAESAHAAAAKEADQLRAELERSAEEAKAALEATRKELAAKLKESESAREAASVESKKLSERLRAAEEAVKKTEAASAAERKALEGQLKEKEAAQAAAAEQADELRTELKKSGDEARATIVANREQFEAKLRDIEAARETASGDTKALGKRLEAAERAAEEARAASAAEREELQARLKDAESAQEAAAKEAEDLRGRLEKALKEARAAAEAERKKLEAKLKEAESAREAASRESKDLGERLEAAEGAAEEIQKAAEEATKRAEKEAKTGAERAEKGAKAAAKEAGELRSRLEKAVKEAEARAKAERKQLEAKLKEAESAREAALRESKELSDGLEAAQRAAEEAKKAAEEAAKRVEKEAKGEAKRAQKEAKAAAKAAAKEAKAALAAERKALKAKAKEVAGSAEEVELLKAELDRKNKEIVELAEREAIGIAEARRYWEEGKRASERLLANEQLVKQLEQQLAELRAQLESK